MALSQVPPKSVRIVFHNASRFHVLVVQCLREQCLVTGGESLKFALHFSLNPSPAQTRIPTNYCSDGSPYPSHPAAHTGPPPYDVMTCDSTDIDVVEVFMMC